MSKQKKAMDLASVRKEKCQNNTFGYQWDWIDELDICDIHLKLIDPIINEELLCLVDTRVTTKMLSYYYYVEYLSRILDSYSYSFVVQYSFVKTDSKIFANESQKGNNSMLYKRTIALAFAYLPW